MNKSAGTFEMLLVEDNPGDVRLVLEALRDGELPCHLSVAKDGTEATDFLWRRGTHRHAPRPDLILLDLNLPGKNGREVLQELKADPELCSIPVAVFTRSASPPHLATTFTIHATSHNTEPFHLAVAITPLPPTAH